MSRRPTRLSPDDESDKTDRTWEMEILTGSFPWEDNLWLKNVEACKTAGHAFAILKINETEEEGRGFCIGRILEEI